MDNLKAILKQNWKLIAGAIVALIIVASLLIPAPASAADLGGNCCADLEERISELEATTARKGNRKVSVTVSGQVNKAILFVDDDEEIIDNVTDGSRLTVSGVAKVSPTFSAGYVLELGTNVDGSQLEFDPLTLGDDGVFVRRSFLFVDTQVGRVSLGKVDGASFGITQMTTANVNVVAPTLNILGFAPANGVIQNNVRYDTPSLYGFVGSASFGTENDSVQVAGRFGGEFAGFRVVAGLGYTETSDNAAIGLADDKILAGSASVMHLTSGLFLSGAFGGNADELSDSVIWHLQGGIERNFFGSGRTTLFAEYADLENFDSQGKAYGLGVVQAIDGAAMDLYVNYRRIDNENLAIVGAKISF